MSEVDDIIASVYKPQAPSQRDLFGQALDYVAKTGKTVKRSPGRRSANFQDLQLEWSEGVLDTVINAQPRRFAKLNGYDEPHQVFTLHQAAVQLADENPAYAATEMKTTIVSRAMGLYQYAKHAYPTYFIDRQFYRDIIEMPAAECTFEDIPFPAPGGMFVLPRGESYFGTVLFSSGVNHQGKPFLTFFGNPRMDKLGERFGQAKSLKEMAEQDMPSYSSVNHIDHRVDIALPMGSGLLVKEDKEKDTERLQEMLAITCKLMIAMSLRPEEVEESVQTRRAKFKGQKMVRSELWSPNVVGRKYAQARKDAEASAERKGVRMHWRRGHMRRVAHGKGRSLRKWVMIDGTLVGGTKD